jgi:hypothetical protein
MSKHLVRIHQRPQRSKLGNVSTLANWHLANCENQRVTLLYTFPSAYVRKVRILIAVRTVAVVICWCKHAVTECGQYKKHSVFETNPRPSSLPMTPSLVTGAPSLMTRTPFVDDGLLSPCPSWCRLCGGCACCTPLVSTVSGTRELPHRYCRCLRGAVRSSSRTGFLQVSTLLMSA